MERQPEAFGQKNIVITLCQLLLLAGSQMHLSVADSPGVLRIENETILKRGAGAVEVVGAEIGLLRSVPSEQANCSRQLLIEAEPDALPDDFVCRIVGPEPDPVCPFRK